jgi:hypothetical protein
MSLVRFVDPLPVPPFCSRLKSAATSSCFASRCEVKVGDTISWLNASMAPHTATADDAQQGWLSAGTIAALRFSKQIKPQAAGKFPYHCKFHDMRSSQIELFLGAPADSRSTRGAESCLFSDPS